MEAKEDMFDQIERYLNNELGGEEKEQFDRKLEDDAAFAAEVKAYVTARETVRASGKADLRKLVDEAYTDLPAFEATDEPSEDNVMKSSTTSAKGKGTGRLVWLAAASVVVIAAIGISLWMGNGTITPQDAYLAYYETPAFLGVRDGDDATAKQLRQAQEAYNVRNWQKAISSLESVLDDPEFPNASEATLFLGIALLEADRAEEAIETFSEITDESSLYEEAQWYTAMAHLKLGNGEKAKAILEQHERDKIDFQSKVTQELLQKLQ